MIHNPNFDPDEDIAPNPDAEPLLLDDYEIDNRIFDAEGLSVEGPCFSGLLDRDRADTFAAALMTVLIGEQTTRMMSQVDEGHSYRQVGTWHGLSGEAVRKRIQAAHKKLKRVHEIAERLEQTINPEE